MSIALGLFTEIEDNVYRSGSLSAEDIHKKLKSRRYCTCGKLQSLGGC